MIARRDRRPSRHGRRWPGAWGERYVDGVAVDRGFGLDACPRGNAEGDGEALRMREGEVHAGVAVGGVLSVLG